MKSYVLPTLSVSNGIGAIEFYKEAFGAEVIAGNTEPDGSTVAELSIKGAHIIVADAAGIKTVYPVADQSYGYRLGHFIDPYGHHWEIGKPL